MKILLVTRKQVGAAFFWLLIVNCLYALSRDWTGYAEFLMHMAIGVFITHLIHVYPFEALREFRRGYWQGVAREMWNRS